MKIKQLDIEGFRSLKKVSWNPDDLNVVKDTPERLPEENSGWQTGRSSHWGRAGSCQRERMFPQVIQKLIFQDDPVDCAREGFNCILRLSVKLNKLRPLQSVRQSANWSG